jgi:hypothetical protein
MRIGGEHSTSAARSARRRGRVSRAARHIVSGTEGVDIGGGASTAIDQMPQFRMIAVPNRDALPVCPEAIDFAPHG